LISFIEPYFSFHRTETENDIHKDIISLAIKACEEQENEPEFVLEQLMRATKLEADFKIELRWYDGVSEWESPCTFVFDADKKKIHITELEYYWEEQFGQEEMAEWLNEDHEWKSVPNPVEFVWDDEPSEN